MTWENYPSTATPRNATNLNKGIFGDTQYGGSISSNFNTITKNGYYTGYGTATGAPNTSYSWFVHHQNSNAGTTSATQRAVAYTTGEPIIMERVKQSSTWGNWYNPLQSGWNYANETWTYSSVDDPTGVITISGDKTTKYSLGMRIKFTNSGNIIYGIITKISYSSPNTTLTFLHEINISTGNSALHLMANSAITANYYSSMKAPYGFPLNPDKWTIYKSLTASSQTDPAQSQIYNLSGYNLSVPIGVWNLGFKANTYSNRVAAGPSSMRAGLSTANNSFSDDGLTILTFAQDILGFMNAVKVDKHVTTTSKTVYYLNIRTDYAGMSSIGFFSLPVVIRAVCGYL